MRAGGSGRLRAPALLAALWLVLLPACSGSGGPADGVVLDYAARQPVADAIVIMRWHGNWTKIGGESSRACYHVETARTDAQGRYRIAAWSISWSFSELRFSGGTVDLDVYKPGQVAVSRATAPASSEEILMAPFKGTKDEYFDQVLSGRTWGCPAAGESRRNLQVVYAAAAKEAAALAETQNQKGLASFWASMAQQVPVSDGQR